MEYFTEHQKDKNEKCFANRDDDYAEFAFLDISATPNMLEILWIIEALPHESHGDAVLGHESEKKNLGEKRRNGASRRQLFVNELMQKG